MAPFKKKPKSWRPSVEEGFVSPVQQSRVHEGKYSIHLWSSPEPAEYDYEKNTVDLSDHIPNIIDGNYCIPFLRLAMMPLHKRLIIFLKAMGVSIAIEEKDWRKLFAYLQSQILDSKEYVEFHVVNEATWNQISARYLADRKAPPKNYVVGLIKSKSNNIESVSLEIDEHLCWILSEFLRVRPHRMIDIQYKWG